MARDVCLITPTSMSNTLPPLAIPPTHRRNNSAYSNISLPPLSSWSDGHRALSSFSSSPPRSSSPPMTPFSTQSSHNFAYIRSSPGFDTEITFHHSVDHIDELPPTWHRAYTPQQVMPQAHELPGFKSLFLEDGPLTHPSRFDASKNTATSIHGHRTSTNKPSDAALRYGPVFCDSEEEEEQDDDDEGYSFIEDTSARATSFRTSAERGQWRYDPIPLKMQSRSHLRQSAPTSSPPPISGLQLLTRPISEPAPSTTTRSSTPRHDSECDGDGDNASADLPSASYADTGSSDQDQYSPAEAPCSLPSLTSDRESTEPEDETMYPSSPLPPSSPPLPPTSLPGSPGMRSMSPLSLASSSPHLAASSPLSFVSALDREADADGDVEDMDLEMDGDADTVPVHHDEGQPVPTPELDPQNVALEIDSIQDPDHTMTVSTCMDVSQAASSSAEPPTLPAEPFPITGVTTEEGIEASAVPTPIAASAEISVRKPEHASESTSTLPLDDCEQVGMQVEGDIGGSTALNVPVAEMLEAKEEDLDQPMLTVTGKGKARAEDDEVEALRDKDENGVVPKAGNAEVEDEKPKNRSKEKRKQKEDGRGDGPVRKKSRLAESEEPTEPTRKPKPKKRADHSGRKAARLERKRRLETEEQEDEDENENDGASAPPKVKKQKKSTAEAPPKRARQSQSISRSSSSSSATSDSSIGSSSKSHVLPRSSKPELRTRPSNPETLALDAEICGMLIESMATSRASCLPVSTLYKLVMQCQPALKAQRGEKEWMEIIERVLWDGEGGVFGKVESSGKDDSNRPLEAQWFYVPEMDQDQERAALIKSMMPRPAKRSVTKKYKQYYYRPLDKISRWDPEDEM